MQGTLRDEPNPDVAKGRIVECLREVGAAAEARGAEFVIEPVNHLQVGFVNTVDEVRRLIRTIGSPAIKPMVDTVHMNIEERSLTQPIYDCGAELRHVHLCESNGGLFGTGHMAFGPILKALDDVAYDGYGSVKVYRHASMVEAAKTSIEYLRKASL
jgi:D-psicose/D-tagatose/L-ribulose 3-epimerase